MTKEEAISFLIEMEEEVDDGLYEEMENAVNTIKAELENLQINYTLLEEKFDSSAEEKVDQLVNALEEAKNKPKEMIAELYKFIKDNYDEHKEYEIMPNNVEKAYDNMYRLGMVQCGCKVKEILDRYAIAEKIKESE